MQDVLMEAYSSGQLKGKKLAAVRRLLERRTRHSSNEGECSRPQDAVAKVTPADLLRLYEREAAKHGLFMVKKSDYTQTKLLFIVEALKELLSDEQFTTLLRAERLTMPRALMARISENLA